MKIQKKIPVLFRVPLALLTHAVAAFGPLVIALYLRTPSVPLAFVLVPGILWIILFDKFISWRLDCFWNLRMMQNRTGRPEHPDNYREFKTLKGWLAWVFVGKDMEHINGAPNQASEGIPRKLGNPQG